MKSDLDALMQAKNLDAILVTGNATHNPPMYYLTGGGHVSAATLIKKRSEPAVLYHQDMERDEAAKSGLTCISYSAYNYDELLNQAAGDLSLASALRYQRMLTDLGVTRGRIGLYGHTELGSAFAAFTSLQRLLPDLELVGETRDNSLFMQAMETKDEAEVAHIRKMGHITTTVVGRVAAYLTACQVRDDEVLLKEGGMPLTIADVKSHINLWLAELGAENPEGCIFSIGRDAGVPHSTGTPDDLLRLGRTIVFDIYPCEACAARPLPEVVVHTGFWGCGAFGGNRVMMTLLQLLAAQLTGLDRLVYHVGEPSGRVSVDRALALARDLVPFTDTSALIDLIEELGLEWGSSDGD